MALYERHRAMLRDRERDVFQDGPDKVSAHDREFCERAIRHDRIAKVREAPVSNDDEASTERLLVLGAAPARAHADDAAGERALDQLRCSRLDEVDAWRGPRARAELLHEAAVVEGAAFCAIWVRDVHGRSCVQDCVAVHGDGVNAVQT